MLASNFMVACTICSAMQVHIFYHAFFPIFWQIYEGKCKGFPIFSHYALVLYDFFIKVPR